MIKVAIVDDNGEDQNTLQDCLQRFSIESERSFEVKVYNNAVDFLEGYDASADIIFMDIEMPQIDGMRAAKKIRELDKEVVIIFVTNFVQYAMNGYEVNAFDFILKPIRYTNFIMMLKRVVNVLEHKRKDYSVNLFLKNGMARVYVSDIVYIEVINHEVIFHMVQREEIKLRGTLTSWAEKLSDKHFVLCNSCYLINLKYVQNINKDEVSVGGYTLKISQSKRKDFLVEVAKYFGGSI